MRKRILGIMLLTTVVAVAMAGSVAAEWHSKENYTFSAGESVEIYFWAGDGNFTCFCFDWSGNQIEITAQANKPVLGIQKATEFQRTISSTSPYNSILVGGWMANSQEMEANETLVQFYWADSVLHPPWEYNTCVMDTQVEEKKWAARFKIITNSSVMFIEEWSSY